MPTYLYECPVHGEFEHQHSIKEELQECPICIEALKTNPYGDVYTVKRLIASGGSFILVGGGWAKDNYH